MHQNLQKKKKINLVKADDRLFSNLYIANQSRASDLDNFFPHENHAFPVLLSEYGKLCRGTKPDFLDFLESINKPTYVKPKIYAIIIDGPALVQMIHPKLSLKTYGSYCEVNS